MRRRLFVFHTESVHVRGGEKFIYEIISRISLSFSVVLYIERINPYWKNLYNHKHIEIRQLWRPRRLYWFLLPFTLVYNYLKLRNLIHPSDVIFSTNFPTNFLSVLLSRKTICHCFEPLAIFYDSERISSLPFKSRIFVKLAKFFYSSLDRFAINQSSVLTTLNKAVDMYICKELFRKADTYISNGIDTNFFSPKVNPLFKKNREALVLVHSTDYTIFKGTEYLLKSLPLVIKKWKNLRVYISESMHDPKIKRRYLDFIQKNHLNSIVKFTGTIPEEMLPGFYRSGDVYCFTGSPRCAGGATASLSVLEAQACAIPVIRSNGNDDEIIPDVTGFIVDPFDTKALARTIIKIIKMSKLQRKEIGIAGRTYVSQRFSWDASAKQLVQTILSLYKPIQSKSYALTNTGVSSVR